MSYRLTRDGQELEISPDVDHDHVYITIGDDDEKYIFAAWHDDAPAVALAILEASGVDYGRYVTMPPASDDIDELCASAAQTLRLAVRQRANKAEREAEDAKVDNWRTFNRLRGQVEVAWKCLSEYERDKWRTNYRAARKFFEES